LLTGRGSARTHLVLVYGGALYGSVRNRAIPVTVVIIFLAGCITKGAICAVSWAAQKSST